MSWIVDLLLDALVWFYPGLFVVLVGVGALFLLGPAVGSGTIVVGVGVGLAAVRWVRRPAPSGRWIPDEPESREMIVMVVLSAWALLLTTIAVGLEAAGVGSKPGWLVLRALAAAGWTAFLVLQLSRRKRRRPGAATPSDGKRP